MTLLVHLKNGNSIMMINPIVKEDCLIDNYYEVFNKRIIPVEEIQFTEIGGK